MVIIKIFGGLGNQMFQYAFGLYMSQKFKVPFCIDVGDFEYYKLRNYELSDLNIEDRIADENITRIFRRAKSAKLNYLINKYVYLRSNYFYEPYTNLDKIELDSINYFWGYWQDSSLYNNIRADLINHFKLKIDLSTSAKVFETQVKTAEFQSVSIHVRKTDYLLKKNDYFVNCGNVYYQKAIEEVKIRVEKPRFFVFSDDFNWVLKNLNFGQNSVSLVNPNIPHSSVEDLHLMKTCQHNIIANSTFSWWAAYLNENPNKIIISPQKWFNNSVRTLNNEGWITLPNE